MVWRSLVTTPSVAGKNVSVNSATRTGLSENPRYSGRFSPMETAERTAS